MTTAAETGVSGHKPGDAWSHQGPEEAGGAVPCSLWRERAPGDVSGLRFGPQPVGRRGPAVGAERPGRGPLLRWPGTLTLAAAATSVGTAAVSSPRPRASPEVWEKRSPGHAARAQVCGLLRQVTRSAARKSSSENRVSPRSPRRPGPEPPRRAVLRL